MNFKNNLLPNSNKFRKLINNLQTKKKYYRKFTSNIENASSNLVPFITKHKPQSDESAVVSSALELQDSNVRERNAVVPAIESIVFILIHPTKVMLNKNMALPTDVLSKYVLPKLRMKNLIFGMIQQSYMISNKHIIFYNDNLIVRERKLFLKKQILVILNLH